MELTDRARADLEAYLARAVEMAGEDPDVDADAVAAGLREHVGAALEARETGDPVTAAELAEVLERLGDPAEWIGEGGEGRRGDPPDPWRAALRRSGRTALRIAGHVIVVVMLLWPLGLAWGAAQRGGFLYAWVEGGTPWSGFRPPIYWARIGAISAGILGAWWLLVGILLLSPLEVPARSRLRSLWGVDPGKALLAAGLVSMSISYLCYLGGLL